MMFQVEQTSLIIIMILNRNNHKVAYKIKFNKIHIYQYLASYLNKIKRHFYINQMNLQQTQQDKIRAENLKLLRRTLLLPQESMMTYLTRIFRKTLITGMNLFKEFTSKYIINRASAQLSQSTPALPQKTHKKQLKFKFSDFDVQAQQVSQIKNDVDQHVVQKPKVDKQISQDYQSEKKKEDESSYDLNRNGRKRRKLNQSQFSSDQSQQNKKGPYTQSQIQSYEITNFNYFLSLQQTWRDMKNKKDVEKKRTNQNEFENSYQNYLERTCKINKNSSQKSSQLTKAIQAAKKFNNEHKQSRVQRKKIQFDDETTQLYDINKVYEVLENQRLRREEIRKVESQNLRKQIQRQQREKIQQEKIQQEKLEMQRIAEENLNQRRRLVQESILRGQDQQRKVRQKEIQKRKEQIERHQQEKKQNSKTDNELLSLRRQRGIPLSGDAKQDNHESPQLVLPSLKKLNSPEKKEPSLFNTPIKSSPQQKPKQVEIKAPIHQTPPNNPFIRNSPAKGPNLQDLIKNYKPNQSLAMFNTVRSPPAPLNNNIFEAPLNVTNVFKSQKVEFPSFMHQNSNIPSTLPHNNSQTMPQNNFQNISNPPFQNSPSPFNNTPVPSNLSLGYLNQPNSMFNSANSVNQSQMAYSFSSGPVNQSGLINNQEMRSFNSYPNPGMFENRPNLFLSPPQAQHQSIFNPTPTNQTNNTYRSNTRGGKKPPIRIS